MSKFKGTKGEWKFIRNKNNFEIETFGISNWIIAKTITNAGQDEANAKLIACAPEMLEMLLTVRNVISNGEANDKHEIVSELYELIKKATS